jgi:hypothetical protein
MSLAAQPVVLATTNTCAGSLLLSSPGAVFKRNQDSRDLHRTVAYFGSRFVSFKCFLLNVLQSILPSSSSSNSRECLSSANNKLQNVYECSTVPFSSAPKLALAQRSPCPTQTWAKIVLSSFNWAPMFPQLSLMFPQLRSNSGCFPNPTTHFDKFHNPRKPKPTTQRTQNPCLTRPYAVLFKLSSFSTQPFLKTTQKKTK